MRIARTVLLGCMMALVIAGPREHAAAQGDPVGCCLITTLATTCAEMVTAESCATSGGTFLAGGTCRGGTPIGENEFLDGVCAPAPTAAPALSKHVTLFAAVMLAGVGLLRLMRRRRADG
ncbi:MAG: hypothetical protein AB7V27_09110 [Candidatus Binatia bacterium]